MKGSVVGALVVASVVAYGVSARAQDPAAKAQDKPAAKEHTMSGCLQKGETPDTYVLMNTEGKGPKVTAILETNQKLAPHVGHRIEITGSDIPAKEVESMKVKPQKADHYMKVTAMKMVSTECK
jgi:hypothetical protein